MDNNLNDILSSIGVNSDNVQAIVIQQVQQSEESPQVEEAQVIDSTPVEEPEETHEQENTESLSEDDINDILSDNGIVSVSEVMENTPGTETLEEYNERHNNEENNEEVENNNSKENNTETKENPALPENSPTLLIDNSSSRFSGTEWYNAIQQKSVILAGLGGIGSHAAFNIARILPKNLVLYDGDTVDFSNMSGQLYGYDSIGSTKADAIGEVINKFTTNRKVTCIHENFTSASVPGDIMICGFDSMSARRVFFNSWKKHVRSLPEDKRSQCLFIDGRLSIDTMQVFCITGDDEYHMKMYIDKYFFSDSEAEDTVCSLKQTTYLASMIGAFIANLFTNFVANTLNPVIPYTLPFFTEYDAKYMIFKEVD